MTHRKSPQSRATHKRLFWLGESPSDSSAFDSSDERTARLRRAFRSAGLPGGWGESEAAAPSLAEPDADPGECGGEEWRSAGPPAPLVSLSLPGDLASMGVRAAAAAAPLPSFLSCAPGVMVWLFSPTTATAATDIATARYSSSGRPRILSREQAK